MCVQELAVTYTSNTVSQIQSDCGLSDTFPQGLFPDNPIVSAPFSCWTLSWAIFWILRVFRTDYNPLTLITPYQPPAMFWSSELPCPETRENCYICISALLRTVLPLGYYWGYYRSHPTILQFLLSIFVVNMSTLSSEKVISRDSNPGPLSLYLNVLPLHHWPDQRHTTPLPVLDRS